MKKKEKDQAEAVTTLKEWGVKDGTVIYAKVNHVSSSGMSRNVGLYIGTGDSIVNISYHAAKALQWPHKDGYAGGVRVTGCGMDMLFATIDALSYAMGYGSICQRIDQIEPEEKRGANGTTINAIGLKYRSL